MKPTLSQTHRAMLIAGALLTMPAAMAADPVVVQTEVRQTESLSASRGDSRVQARLAGDFSVFAGSEENARNLFTGLRNGTPITLSSSSTTGGTTTTNQLTFDTPTRPMGNGNVFISLALAKQQLASYGITDPTPQQIQVALTGGTITPGDPTAKPVVLKGVLTQRASGMGWGEIARTSGVNLGHVVSGLKNHNAGIVTGATVTTNPGITTAAGTAVQSGANANANANGSAMSLDHGNSASAPGHNRGTGIVSATGGALGGGLNTNANAQAGARAGGVGAGIVTGSGAAATARGGANAQGNAKGLLRN